LGKQVEIIAFAIEEVTPNGKMADQTLTQLASEKVLAKDWLTPEEDSVWQDL